MGCCSSIKQSRSENDPRSSTRRDQSAERIIQNGQNQAVSTKDVVLQMQDVPVSSVSSYQGSRQEQRRHRKYLGIHESLNIPKLVMNHIELLELTIKGESIHREQVADIRGLDRGIPDSVQGSNLDDEPFGTIMWNPLYFAVHYGHLDIVKELLKTVKYQSTVPKSNSENEKDPTNVVSFKEDKQLLLMIAYGRISEPKFLQIMSLLLNELHMFWPTNTVDYLLVENYNEHLNNGMEPCNGFIKTVLSSKTAHLLYLNMSFNKRREWLHDFVGNLKSSTSEEVFTEYLTELSQQPYAGNLLFYLLFEEYSDDKQLVEKVYSNILKVDLSIQMTFYESVEAYFDINRMLKLSEKFDDPAVYELMNKVVSQMVGIEQQGVYPTDFFNKIRTKLIQKAASPDTTVEEIQQLTQQIYELYKWDVFECLTAIKTNNIAQIEAVNLQKLLEDNFCQEDESQPGAFTHKWNPMTFAIYNANLPLIKFLFTYAKQRVRKLVKVPGLQSSDLNRLFPFYVALRHDSEEMFTYFWEDLGGYLYRQSHFESLLTLLIKRSALGFIKILLKSQTTRQIFNAMSYCYRFTFIERIIQQKAEILEEYVQSHSPQLKKAHYMANNSQRISENSINVSIQNEGEIFDADIRENLDATFNIIYQLLAEEFPLQFLISYTKQRDASQPNEDMQELLANAHHRITSECIELFVYYQSEVALQMVKDLWTSKKEPDTSQIPFQFARRLADSPGFSKIAADINNK